jgi:hypothetical protein
MRFFLHYKSALLFGILLALCSGMVLRQFHTNERRHVELREAFILLSSKGGYEPQAKHLYQRLIQELPGLSEEQLQNDFQRTHTLIDPAKKDTDNLLWKYHWTLNNELEKRSVQALPRALKLAGED